MLIVWIPRESLNERDKRNFSISDYDVFAKVNINRNSCISLFDTWELSSLSYIEIGFDSYSISVNTFRLSHLFFLSFISKMILNRNHLWFLYRLSVKSLSWQFFKTCQFLHIFKIAQKQNYYALKHSIVITQNFQLHQHNNFNMFSLLFHSYSKVKNSCVFCPKTIVGFLFFINKIHFAENEIYWTTRKTKMKLLFKRWSMFFHCKIYS